MQDTDIEIAFVEFQEKYNIVYAQYRNYVMSHSTETSVYFNNIDLDKLEADTFIAILDYGRINRVDVVTSFDDMKITYFLALSFYEQLEIKNNIVLLIALDILLLSLDDKNSKIIQKIIHSLELKCDFKKYYGKYGIYMCFKAIYYKNKDNKKFPKEILDKIIFTIVKLIMLVN